MLSGSSHILINLMFWKRLILELKLDSDVLTLKKKKHLLFSFGGFYGIGKDIYSEAVVDTKLFMIVFRIFYITCYNTLLLMLCILSCKCFVFQIVVVCTFKSLLIAEPAYASPCSFMGEIFGRALPLPSSSWGWEWGTSSKSPAGFMPSEGLEFTGSLF